MGILRGPETARRLRARHLVGRGPESDLRLADPRISGSHAVIRWSGVDWVVRDLGSRNGTSVDGARIPPGHDVSLASGAALAFGGMPVPWIVDDVAPPSLFAERAGEERVSVGEWLELDAETVIYRAPDGAWVVEGPDDGPQPVADRAVVLGWQVALPGAEVGTLEASPSGLALSSVSLYFRVSRDEEHVELDVEADGRRHALGARSHHYLLLTLARVRLADADPNPAERGWVATSDLLRQLRTTDNRLNVEIFRARRQIAEVGVANPAALIERRTDTRQLRLGTDRVDVAPT